MSVHYIMAKVAYIFKWSLVFDREASKSPWALTLGYFFSVAADIYWEVMELRKQMACAKCGLSPLQ
jgi:hypothetical protein